MPSQSPAWSSSSLITGRHVHQTLSPQTPHVSQTSGVARVSPTAQSMHQGDMTLSERRSVGSQPVGTRAKQGLLARLLRPRSHNSDVSRSRTPSRQWSWVSLCVTRQTVRVNRLYRPYHVPSIGQVCCSGGRWAMLCAPQILVCAQSSFTEACCLLHGASRFIWQGCHNIETLH